MLRFTRGRAGLVTTPLSHRRKRDRLAAPRRDSITLQLIANSYRLTAQGSDRIRQIAPRDRAGLVAADAIGEEGHCQAGVAVGPAHRRPETTVPEGALRAGRAWPLPLRVVQSTQLKPEAAANRNIEHGIDRAIDLH